jgi:ectoine hydroxylase-related dioxygenase (phytanoyl-CoA dioxygenase family)
MTPSPSWFSIDECDIREFAAIVEQPVLVEDYPHASCVEQGVLIYETSTIRAAAGESRSRHELLGELATALADGPGVVLLRGAFDDEAVLDRATEVFRQIIAKEKATGMAAGDHFAAAGANDRVWNALEKLAVVDPDTFVRYYANDVLALVCEAWLGAGYQVTSQINQVNPGGKAQSPHRDYHLGFQSPQSAEAYPAHVHRMSPALTLQGGIAHDDVPLEAGPTFLLPNSQKYGPGYLASGLPEFREYSERMAVQIPFAKGDAVFFNPALFHGAGSNLTTNTQRLVNLLQVSSPFGRAMESVDRQRIVASIYPSLLAFKAGVAPDGLLRNAVAASAEGYAFPINLDVNPPEGSHAPPAQADIVLQALDESWSVEELLTRI